ncbi:MAG TPA: oxidoreductase [Candidatus Latescibacteria bacterium]|nr:oxidoreductase [Candidatus Latescibacterota bacterium]
MVSNKVKIGFIGAGWWATSNHLPILVDRDDVEMVGVCRLGQTELKQVQERFGFAYATEDYRKLLNDCELDGVVVASPHTLHHEHALAALDAGLHVMCEKPMTTRAHHARKLVNRAREKGRHLLVPYGWHYKSFVQRAKELLDASSVGTIEYVLCHMASPVRTLLSGQEFDTGADSGSSGPGVFEPDLSTWSDPVKSDGGYGHAQLSHALGMLFWITGLRAKSIFALMSGPGAEVDLYDAMTVRFDAGAIGTFSGSGSIPVGQGFQVDLRIFGDEGMLLLDCERARMELIRHDGGSESVDLEPNAGAYACTDPPKNFVDLISGATEVNYAPGEVAMRSVEVLDAAYRSSVSGKEEDV